MDLRNAAQEYLLDRNKYPSGGIRQPYKKTQQLIKKVPPKGGTFLVAGKN